MKSDTRIANVRRARFVPRCDEMERRVLMAAPAVASNGALPAHYFAPYIDMLQTTANHDAFDPTAPSWNFDVSKAYNMLQGNVKVFLLSFVNGMKVKSGASEKWVAGWTGSGGVNIPVDPSLAQDPNQRNWSDVFKQSIANFEQKGATPVVVFGGNAARPATGFNGNELALKITNVDELAQAYQSVVKEYGAKVLDFDIEWTDNESQAVVDRRNQALALLQKEDPGLQIGYTVPGSPQSGSDGGIGRYVRLLTSAKASGVNLSFVNIMTMSFGQWNSNNFTEFELIQKSVNPAIGQIAQAYTDGNVAAAKGLIGVTPMIGSGDYNKYTTEVFFLNRVEAGTYANYAGTPMTARPSDAQELLNYAQSQGFEFISEWSLARDRPYANLSPALQAAVHQSIKNDSVEATALSTDVWSVTKPKWTFANPPQLESTNFAYADLLSRFGK